MKLPCCFAFFLTFLLTTTASVASAQTDATNGAPRAVGVAPAVAREEPSPRLIAGTRGMLFRTHEGGRRVTCERRSDGATRCVPMRLSSPVIGRTLLVSGAAVVSVAALYALVGMASDIGCHWEGCGNDGAYRLPSSLLAGTGAVLMVAGLGQLLRYHHVRYSLARIRFAVAPMVDLGGVGARGRASTGLVLHLGF
jgi:hypothetical protein